MPQILKIIDENRTLVLVNIMIYILATLLDIVGLKLRVGNVSKFLWSVPRIGTVLTDNLPAQLLLDTVPEKGDYWELRSVYIVDVRICIQ